MSDFSDNNFRAATQSLRDVIRPAINPADPLAMEQIDLIIDWLEFQRTRLPYVRDRQRFELQANLEMAQTLCGLGIREIDAVLGADIAAARRLLADAAARSQNLQEAAAALESGISSVVRSSVEFETADREAIERIVIEGSAGIIALQRAWFLPFGIEPNPNAVPTLEQALQLGV